MQAEEPQLADAPLILSARDSRRGLVVAAANLAARSAGIRPSMRLSEATALVDTEVREHDSQEDLDGLCMLAEQAQQFSPLVGLEQLDKQLWSGRTLHQPECLLLDVTGLASLFGGEVELLNQISRWLEQHHYFGCMAIAGSIGAAWAVANYATRNKKTHPNPNDQQRPGETTEEESPQPMIPLSRYQIVPTGLEDEMLAPLPLAALRLSKQTVASLNRLGIRAIGQLVTLPRDGMATRLGCDLITRWDQAFDRKAEPVISLHSLPDWSLEQTLEHPTQHRETIAELVRRLSQDLSKKLHKRGEGALRIVCRMDLVQSQPLILQLGLFRPTNDAAHLALLLDGQLEQPLRQLKSAALWRLSLQATLTAPMIWRQTDLFDGGEAASRNQLARLVDTLSSRLGRKQVLSAHAKREAQPESACTFSPLTGRRHNGSPQTTVKKLSSRLSQNRIEPSRDDLLRRPTQLFKNPIATSVRFKNSHDASSPSGTRYATAPNAFEYQGRWHPVAEAIGPERLESGWWRGPSVRRDYYRVSTPHGDWWWLFRDLNSGQWFLHGAFD